ncbi:hypothetical protein HPB50_000759 [Hyalomma asiaticum]|uniref:Uncharacterized protein n=1 Tax=Hyalomma asiaticum TaxID=266040 RepID=A0ACB7SWH4_HYAAI|nr:hypothetical protein HPB50_000759 [Hyalomma asiaticum]
MFLVPTPLTRGSLKLCLICLCEDEEEEDEIKTVEDETKKPKYNKRRRKITMAKKKEQMESKSRRTKTGRKQTKKIVQGEKRKNQRLGRAESAMRPRGGRSPSARSVGAPVAVACAVLLASLPPLSRAEAPTTEEGGAALSYGNRTLLGGIPVTQQPANRAALMATALPATLGLGGILYGLTVLPALLALFGSGGAFPLTGLLGSLFREKRSVVAASYGAGGRLPRELSCPSDAILVKESAKDSSLQWQAIQRIVRLFKLQLRVASLTPYVR